MAANNMKLDVDFDNLNEEGARKASDEILQQTAYLSKTIDDFSNFFKPTDQLETLEPQNVLAKSMEYGGINIITNYEDTGPIESYSREILQILLNIIKNSREALELMDSQDKKVEINLINSENSIYIKICDNAGGIKEEIMEKIFDPYFSTKKEKNGTGLGLFMSKTIVSKYLFGKLWAENIQNGACFTLEVPKKYQNSKYEPGNPAA